MAGRGGREGKEALVPRQFTSVPLRVEWLWQEDNCAWRKSNSRNSKNSIYLHAAFLFADSEGEEYEKWKAAGGKAGSVITTGVAGHAITPLAHSFISFCLCSPLGCLPDEVNTPLSCLMTSTRRRISLSTFNRCRSFRGDFLHFSCTSDGRRSLD